MAFSQIGLLLIFLTCALLLARICGSIFAKWRQPRVIGEIFAGVLLGPIVAGRFIGMGWTSASTPAGTGLILPLEFISWTGLLLLMFFSGVEVRSLFCRTERKPISWLAAVGTGVPFIVAIVLGSMVSLTSLMGSAQSRPAIILVIGISVAVTSIPVISRIFHDLKLLHTRFARLVLGVAVVEDIVLWAILSVATSLAKSGDAVSAVEIFKEVAITSTYFAVALSVVPKILKRWQKSLAFLSRFPASISIAVAAGYLLVAMQLGVSLVFAAFLAGLAVPGAVDPLQRLRKLSFSIFIPLYFVLVGYKLNLGAEFSWGVLLLFLMGACAVKIAAVYAGAYFGGFRGLAPINLAIATNARGGPGIVLATVALSSGIINPGFYTVLILVALLTSQAAGAWLQFVISRGWPLLDDEINPVVERTPREVLEREPSVAA